MAGKGLLRRIPPGTDAAGEWGQNRPVDASSRAARVAARLGRPGLSGPSGASREGAGERRPAPAATRSPSSVWLCGWVRAEKHNWGLTRPARTRKLSAAVGARAATTGSAGHRRSWKEVAGEG